MIRFVEELWGRERKYKGAHQHTVEWCEVVVLGLAQLDEVETLCVARSERADGES